MTDLPVRQLDPRNFPVLQLHGLGTVGGSFTMSDLDSEIRLEFERVSSFQLLERERDFNILIYAGLNLLVVVVVVVVLFVVLQERQEETQDDRPDRVETYR